jgi:hypothetical protein
MKATATRTGSPSFGHIPSLPWVADVCAGGVVALAGVAALVLLLITAKYMSEDEKAEGMVMHSNLMMHSSCLLYVACSHQLQNRQCQTLLHSGK